MNGPPAPVVIAISHRDPAQDPVEWAAAEAAARDCPLRIVHVAPLPIPVDAWGVIPVAPLSDVTVREQVVAMARQRAAAVAGDLQVTELPCVGPVARVLLRASEDAALLVVAGRRGGAVRRLLPASVPSHVLARARCPVAVVLARSAARVAASGPRVVAGLDDIRSCSPVLDLAFGAAAQREVPLLVVRSWRPDAPVDLEGVCGASADAAARVADELEQLLGRWRNAFPDVPVSSRLVDADLGSVLVDEGRGAALVVVAGPRRRLVSDCRTRAVGRVTRRAHPPVVVLPAGARRPGVTGSDRRPGRRPPWE